MTRTPAARAAASRDDDASGAVIVLLFQGMFAAAAVSIRRYAGPSPILGASAALIPVAAAFASLAVSLGALLFTPRLESLAPFFLFWLRLWPRPRSYPDRVVLLAAAGLLGACGVSGGLAPAWSALISLTFLVLVGLPMLHRFPQPAAGLNPGLVLQGLGLGGLTLVSTVRTAMLDEDAAWLAAAGLAASWVLQASRVRGFVAGAWPEALPPPPEPPALELDRFSIAVSERPSQDAAPREEARTAPMLVGSGTFRVDVARMVDKLRGFQLNDPWEFMSPWLRCAVASGAKRIGLERFSGGFYMRFDGRPFSADELKAPYDGLLGGEAPEAVRGKHFAYGLLALERLRPRSIHISSKGPEGRATATFLAKGLPDEETDLGGFDGTSIRVRWGGWFPFWKTRRAFRRARAAYGLSPAALSIEGAAVPQGPPEEDGWRRVQKGGWRGVVRPEPASDVSRVRFYRLGAFVEEVERKLDRTHARPCRGA